MDQRYVLLSAMLLCGCATGRSGGGDVDVEPFCGDGMLEEGEQCDDGNNTSGDGCSDGCVIEMASCGNGVIDMGEECDASGASAQCDADCSFAVCGDGTLNELAGEICDDGGTLAGDGCSNTCTREARCGDGMVEGDEECDESGETPTCTSACLLPVCGDGVVNGMEQCDDGGASATCTIECTLISCGDGVVNGDELCDDGMQSATCDVDCTPAECGDGVTNVMAGEECDAAGETAGCDMDCTLAACGDGYVNAAAREDCDESGMTATCDNDCTIAECGDGIVNMPAGEQCDDDTETCVMCALGECGDGVVQPSLGETCDDAGESATCDGDCTAAECGDRILNRTAGETCDAGMVTAACNADCTNASCGDGETNAAAGEQCDSGGINTRTCDVDCTVPMCGDGVHNPAAGEVCDAGGESVTCDNDCTPAQCGDGVLNTSAGEECDTGGATAACDADCTVPRCGDGVLNTAAGEVCDGDNVGGRTCSASGATFGEVTCGAGCRSFDMSECVTCSTFGASIAGYRGCQRSVGSVPCENITTTGVATSLGDDGATTANLGFSFSVFGGSVSSVSIGSNGVLVLGSGTPSFANVCLPTATITAPFVAAFWDDLNPSTTGSEVYYKTTGAIGERVFTVQWQTQHFPSSTGFLDARVQLMEETGLIRVCYANTVFGSSDDRGASATVGLQRNSSSAIQFSCDTAQLSNGLVLEYIPPGL